jgi:hypothetical protein
MTFGVEKKGGDPIELTHHRLEALADRDHPAKPDKNCQSACKFLANGFSIACRERSWS